MAETLRRAAFGRIDEAAVPLVDIRGQQARGLRIRARHQQRGHAADISGEACGDQLVDGFLRRNEHLSAHVAAFLRRGELILEVHPGGARLDHLLHQLESIEHAAEASLRVSDDGLEPVDGVIAFGMVDLIGAAQRVVDSTHHRGHGVRRIERLIRVHLAREIRIPGHLPPRQVDGVEPGLDLLHRLVARQSAEGIHEGLLVEVAPQLLRRHPRNRMLDRDGAPQPDHFIRTVTTLHAAPARALLPITGQLFGARQQSIGGH